MFNSEKLKLHYWLAYSGVKALALINNSTHNELLLTKMVQNIFTKVRSENG